MIAAVVVVLLIGAVFYFKSTKSTTQPTDQTAITQPSADSSTVSSSDVPAASDSAVAGTTKEFTVEGSNFKFAPAVLSVNKGDTVKITFNNTGGMHDFVIDEFNAKTKVIQSGATETITFTADKTGTFQYYCSVGNHKAMGMVGTLTVQ